MSTSLHQCAAAPAARCHGCSSHAAAACGPPLAGALWAAAAASTLHNQGDGGELEEEAAATGKGPSPSPPFDPCGGRGVREEEQLLAPLPWPVRPTAPKSTVREREKGNVGLTPSRRSAAGAAGALARVESRAALSSPSSGRTAAPNRAGPLRIPAVLALNPCDAAGRMGCSGAASAHGSRWGGQRRPVRGSR